MSSIKILNDDCLNVLAKMPDKSIDLCLTDPPYGITKDDWDVLPSKEIFEQIFRVTKNQIIFGGHWFDLPKKDGWLIWNKMPFLKTTNEVELIWTSLLKKNKKIDFRYAGNVVGNTKRPNYKREKVFFTSEKPIEFLEALIAYLGISDCSIIDPFMGTGNVGLAAKGRGCSFIGVEKDAVHFDIAKKRIQKLTAECGEKDGRDGN